MDASDADHESVGTEYKRISSDMVLPVMNRPKIFPIARAALEAVGVDDESIPIPFLRDSIALKSPE